MSSLEYQNPETYRNILPYRGVDVPIPDPTNPENEYTAQDQWREGANGFVQVGNYFGGSWNQGGG